MSISKGSIVALYSKKQMEKSRKKLSEFRKPMQQYIAKDAPSRLFLCIKST